MIVRHVLKLQGTRPLLMQPTWLQCEAEERFNARTAIMMRTAGNWRMQASDGRVPAAVDCWLTCTPSESVA